MSLFDKAKAKAEELLGHAEEVYGQSHGDAAATLDGEARRLEAEAEEEQAAHEQAPHEQAPHEQAPQVRSPRSPGNDGLAGAR